jgi:hypothetical protein
MLVQGRVLVQVQVQVQGLVEVLVEVGSVVLLLQT